MTQSAASIRDLFENALALDPAARADYLARHCADAAQRIVVERMLALDADDAECVFDRSFNALLDRVGDAAAEPPPLGSAIGTFVLLDKLGEGGSSIVYRAEREQSGVKQIVALKLLRRGVYDEHERRRFRDERRALAQLRHPGVARLIEGGVTDNGIPYIALELVEGQPITAFARANRLGLRQRLKLFVNVCRAVDAAHRALIVHCDLKPSNVLVAGDGEVKLLDFGIAKWLDAGDDGTQTQQTALTPAYAAPEQIARGAITTATDVYALGVLLDELVTGQLRAADDDRMPSARIGAAAEPGKLPESPQAMRRQLRGDLDNIVMKATAPEPERRYASAGAFADDIEGYLTDEPVAAHPPSARYRLRKFALRHKGGVAATTLLLMAILVAFGIVLREAQIVRNEARRANAVRDFVVGLFDSARAHLPRDARPTPEALVRQAQKRLAAASDVAPDTRADLLRTLGEVELSLSDFARAQTLFNQASALAEQTGDVAGVRAARVLHADALQRAGKNAEALREVNAELDALRASPTPLTVRALGVLAESEHMTGANDAAIAHRRAAQRTAIMLYGENGPEAIAAGFDVGNALAEAERFREAITVLKPLLARWRAQRAPEDDRYVAALDSLATAEDGVGDLTQSEARFRELLALKRRIYTAPHDAIAKTLRDLSAVLARAEKYAEAESLANEALDMQRKVFGENHREVAMTYNQLAEVMVQQRRYAEAETDFRAAIAICAHTGLHEEVCSLAHNNFGMVLYRQGRLDEAKLEMTEALAENRTLYGNDHPEVAYSLSTLSNVAAKQGDYAQAVRLSAESLAILDRNGVGASIEAVLVRFSYAYALWKAQRDDEALREIDRTLADWQRASPNGHSRRVTMLMQKAFILRDLKRADEAKKIADEAIALGVDPAQLSPTTKKSLRELSGRSDVYPEVAGKADIPAW
jgi:serine/threonine-protein kinase